MPRNKDLKRLVRTRMDKTGESYTAAHAQVTRRSRTQAEGLVVSAPKPAPGTLPLAKDYARVAGTSDETLKEKTGRTWERWVHVLDRRGAERMSHREIAAIVNEEYNISGWWSQTVTVGYERIKGLRARGQRRDGTYEAGKSRTFNVPVATLFDAWANANIRRRWLPGRNVSVRTATAPKSMRLDWPDRSIIAVGFIARGASRSTVAVEHTKLPDRETADRLKKYWSERLDALAELLAGRHSESGGVVH